MAAVSQFLDTLSRRKTTWTELAAGQASPSFRSTGLSRPIDAHENNGPAKAGTPNRDALSKQLESVPTLFAAATTLAANAAKPDGDRIIAAALLARDSSTKTIAIQILGEWLTPKTPGLIQRAAVQALGITADDAVPRILIKNWIALGPETRVAVLDELMGREAWTFALVQQIDAGIVSPASLDAVHKDRLLRHRSPRVKELAAKVLNAGGTASRAKVIEEFRPALALTGDPKRGAAVHARLCAVCHKLGDLGNDIGPNLQSVVAHPPEKLIVSILDPNASIEPGYLAYSCTLVGGEELYGIIAAETGNSLILKMADGKSRTILLTNIAALRSSNLSLMPEGLESGMTKQDLADLITFLRTPSGH